MARVGGADVHADRGGRLLPGLQDAPMARLVGALQHQDQIHGQLHLQRIQPKFEFRRGAGELISYIRSLMTFNDGS